MLGGTRRQRRRCHRVNYHLRERGKGTDGISLVLRILCRRSGRLLVGASSSYATILA